MDFRGMNYRREVEAQLTQSRQISAIYFCAVFLSFASKHFLLFRLENPRPIDRCLNPHWV